MLAAAVLAHPSDHGGEVIDASETVFIEGAGAVRLGHRHACPLPGHGVTEMVWTPSTTLVDGRPLCCATARAGCGAVLVQVARSVVVVPREPAP